MSTDAVGLDSARTVLTDAERAALWPAMLTDVSDLELEALERGWKRERAAREVAIFSLGLLGGAMVIVVIFAVWLLAS